MQHFMCSVQSSSEGVSLGPKGPFSTSCVQCSPVLKVSALAPRAHSALHVFSAVRFLRCQPWPQGFLHHFMCSVQFSSEGVSLGPKGPCSSSCVQFSPVLKVSALAPRAHAALHVFSAVQFLRCQPRPQWLMQNFMCSVQSSSEVVSLGPKGPCSTLCVQFRPVLKVSNLAPRAHAELHVFSAVQF